MRLLHGEFSAVLSQLGSNGVRADAILLDLGVSSMQLDRPERGFSYATDAPLDMRMDPSAALTAREVVNETGEWELADILRRYGEERYARQIARAIVRRRAEQPFARTADLVATIKQAIPAPARFGEGHPAKRVFQALRIEVNDELGALERALPAALEMLRPHGRLAVISFHSLEDRIVKRFLRDGEHGCTCPPDFPRCACGATPTAAGRPAPRYQAEPGRDRPQPALGFGAPAGRGKGWLAPAEARSRRPRATRAPGRPRLGRLAARPRRQRRPAREPARNVPALRTPAPTARGAILWIGIGAVLLAGVVFINLADLRLNLRLEQATQARASCAPRTRRSSRSSRSRWPRGGSSSSRRRATGSSRRTLDDRLHQPRQVGAVASPIQDKQANRRVRLLGVVLALALAGMFGRAFWLQAVSASHLAELARSEHQAPEQIPATRGTIFDRTGVPLAIGVQETTIFADPKQVRNPRGIALAAASMFGVNGNTLYPQLVDKKRQFVYIERFANPAKAALFLKRGFLGVDAYPEDRRTYPEGTVGAQVVGYAGVDDTGLGGLELAYNASLAGRSGTETVLRDPSGRPIEVLAASPGRGGCEPLHDDRPHDPGASRAGAAKDGAHLGGEGRHRDRARSDDRRHPRDGPDADLQRQPDAEVPPADLRNRAVTDTYEPGSTFKLVTITGALSEGLVTPATRFTLPYELKYGPCWQCSVHDAELRPTETLSVAQILSHSSNVGAVTIARKLGPKALQAWIAKFGFGSPTGIDFPGESAGFRPAARRSGARRRSGTYRSGKGISVTPIQMASVYAAVANGGVWIQPHLVDRVGGRQPSGGPIVGSCRARSTPR